MEPSDLVQPLQDNSNGKRKAGRPKLRRLDGVEPDAGWNPQLEDYRWREDSFKIAVYVVAMMIWCVNKIELDCMTTSHVFITY